ncbi:MAG: hypothetical protein WBV70_02205 [Candidatus Bathyarchaeia archaeon]
MVVETARHDRIRAEKVCLLDNGQIAEALNKRFNAVIVGADCFDKGEVVMDSRGKGSLQLPDSHRDWELAIV